MAADRKPPGDEHGLDADEIYGDVFEDAPGTDPTMPTVPALAEDVTVEVPDAEAAERTIVAEEFGAAITADGPAIEEPTAFAPLLPEMEAEIWQAGLQALVSVPDQIAPAPADRAEWMAEARLLEREGALSESPEEAAARLFAAGRAAEAAGDGETAARAYDEALDKSPSAPEVLRARARLAESAGEIDEAHALWARLSLAAETAEERAYYAALSAEWTLARLGELPPVMLEAVPTGPARALALVEAALRRQPAAAVARALAEAGAVVGDALGAALLGEASRFAEAAGDLAAAAAYSTAAGKAGAEPQAGLFARLRAAARLDARKAGAAVAELCAGLPPGSVLGAAVGRWAAALARRNGDLARAGELLAGVGASTRAAARDRIDLDFARGVPLDPASVTRLRSEAELGVPAATLASVEAEDLVRRGELSAAAAVLTPAIEAQPDAVFLGLQAQALAEATSDERLRASALELWLGTDAARRAEAGLELAVARDAGGAGNALAARAALQIAVEAAPGSALFWRAAASDARSGRRSDAAATLAYGADSFGPGPLGAALSALAAVKYAVGDPARALGALRGREGGPLAELGRALGWEATARLAERAGDHPALVETLTEASTTENDPERRAWLAVRRACSFPLAEIEARAEALAEALAAVPAHPLALPLALLDAEEAALATTFERAGESSSPSSGLGRVLALGSYAAQALAGDAAGALQAAQRLAARAPEDLLARRAVVRAAGGLPPEARRTALAAVAVDDGLAAEAPAAVLAVAEARMEAAAPERALEALAAIPDGRFVPEILRLRARARAGAPAGAGLPSGWSSSPADRAAAAAGAAIVAIVELARAERLTQLIAALESAPPHEAAVGPPTLAFAALLAAGRGLAPAAARLAAAAVAAVADDPSGVPRAVLAEVAGSDEAPALRARALELAAAGFGAAESDRLSAAVAHADRARVEEAAGAAAAAVESWRRALVAHPSYLPAALASRREAARRGDQPEAAAACETEAACLVLPAHRVRALLLAAALALDGAAPDRDRALSFLRAALAVEPGQEAAFERLRALLEERGDARALAAALAARIEVAQNPFEVTSLRLARAELLASPAIGDRAGARAELGAVLDKQPEHGRALGRLADLLWEEQAWAEAGEVYLKRAVIERDPPTLREIFLRLGQIYSERVPDPKRAVTAYERLLTVDPDNLEGLRALSDLYVAEGETKLALPVTERLCAREEDPARRIALRVRLGEILLRTGDLRRAGIELRAAVNEAPRDLAAVSALAHYFERAHDPAGRKAVLDRSVGLLRHEVERGQTGALDLGTLRMLARLLALRERPHAALAVAQLVAALDPNGNRAATARPPRRLSGLRAPELDERAQPPGLPPGIRQLLRVLGPALRPSGQDLARNVARHGVTRADRRARGTAPRPAFDAVAAELGAGEVELYVKASSAASGPVALRAEPGNPPSIILGAPLAELGAAALRFAAGRALRLASTQLDLLLAVPQEEAAALVVAIIRQFVPDFRHPAVREELVAAEALRAERAITRKLRPQLMPFAVESAGPFDVDALYAAVRDGANAVGLLGAADLPAALSVILALSGTVVGKPAGGARDLTLPAIVANPEALALLRFAISDDYDELAGALES